MTYGCVFCRTGKEESFASTITETFPNMETIVAKKMRVIRKGRDSVEEAVILFPGYVFFRMEVDETRARKAFPIEFQQIYRWSDTYRLLTNVDGDWQLMGSDLQMDQRLFDEGGTVGFSKVFFDEGNRVRVLEGFLKDYEGNIVRVDKRHRAVQVRVDFQGKTVTMWLGYEVIEKPDEVSKNADEARHDQVK